MTPPLDMHDAGAEVVSLRNRMSEDEYERERQHLRSIYGGSSAEAAAKRDQAMAKLFARCGWTQEELAEKEGIAQPTVAVRLRFGRFLNFITTVITTDKLPVNLTEGGFRKYWARTDKSERAEHVRFRMIYDMMLEDDIPARRERRPKIGKELIDQFADDGKFHAPRTIAARLGKEADHVEETLRTMRALGTYNTKVERKKVGREFQYRIFRRNKEVSLVELTEKLSPIIKELKLEGRKNAATISIAAIAILAGELQKLLDKWAE